MMHLITPLVHHMCGFKLEPATSWHLPGPALVRPRRASQLQHPFPKSTCNLVDGLQQTIVDFTLLGLIKEVSLHRLGLSLLPVAYPDTDEPHRLARYDCMDNGMDPLHFITGLKRAKMEL